MVYPCAFSILAGPRKAVASAKKSVASEPVALYDKLIATFPEIDRKGAANPAKLFVAGVVKAALPATADSILDMGGGTYSYHSLSIDDMIVELKALRILQIEMSLGEPGGRRARLPLRAPWLALTCERMVSSIP